MVNALEGIKILDLSLLFPGPFGTRYLADFGADIIRVEYRKKQDMARIPPPMAGDKSQKKRQSYFHHILNRNKRTISINLTTPEGVEIFKKLAKEADVIVEQFRPGVVDKLGIGYEEIKKINPRIVYCSITGYGQNGPYRDKAGHDLNYTGFAGLASLHRTREMEPVLPGIQIADMFGGGLHAIIGILIALIAREKTGKGQYIDISMMDGCVSFLPYILQAYLTDSVKINVKNTTLTGGLPAYQIFKCKDGKYITIGAIEPKFYQELCVALKKEGLFDKDSMEQSYEVFKNVFLQKTRDEWFEILQKIDTCVAPMNEIWEVEEDPQVKARNMIIEVDTIHGKMKQIGFPIKLSETPANFRFGAPLPDEHTDEILKGLGFSDEELKELKKVKKAI
ncbi:MAG: CoA transferase [Candidatus Lokiarchaeota archaeon]|nr:CoA transferase [Candidatus Lokiarchaeota archaeon]